MMQASATTSQSTSNPMQVIASRADATAPARPSRRRPISPVAIFGMLILATVIIASIVGPMLSPYDPIAMSPGNRLLPPGSPGHLLGTDKVGRDVLTRLMAGGRQTLTIGAAPVLLSLIVGVTLGLIAAYYGRWVDEGIMRVLDVLFAFPPVLLAIAIVAALGPSLFNAILATTVVSVPTVARLIRAPVLSLKEQAFVQAARAIGARDSWIIVRHIGRNVVSPIVVFASVEMGAMILFGSGLSFLGLGAQPPSPEWGLMLSEGRDVLVLTPHVATIPGLAIVVVVLGLNFIGDALRDRLDPRDSA